MPISLSYSQQAEGYGAPYPVEEPSRFPQNPSPFGELHFSPFQRLVTVIKRRHSLLKAFASISEFVYLGR